MGTALSCREHQLALFIEWVSSILKVASLCTAVLFSFKRCCYGNHLMIYSLQDRYSKIAVCSHPSAADEAWYIG